MSKKPRCLFLASSADFEQTFSAPLRERLASVADIRRADASKATQSLDGVQICVSWDDSPPVSVAIDRLDLIVHCGLTPKRVFPALDVPTAWSDCPDQSDRPGPRAWDNAGLQRFGGGHWRTATEWGATTTRGSRIAVVSEPFERAIAEKLLAVIVMAICSAEFGRYGTDVAAGPSPVLAAMRRDFYDISVGIVGWGGSAVALCRLLRGYEVGLLLHDPDISGQAAHEMGCRLVADVGELARDADIVVLLPYKNAELAGMPNVRFLPGLDGLLPNSLSRVGRHIVYVLHRHVAERSR